MKLHLKHCRCVVLHTTAMSGGFVWFCAVPFDVCVACWCLVLDVTDHVVLTVTDKCLLSQLLWCQLVFTPRYVRRCHSLNLVFVFLSSTSQPSAMAEHLGIEFMGMEQSILILSPSIATGMSVILTCSCPFCGLNCESYCPSINQSTSWVIIP